MASAECVPPGSVDEGEWFAVPAWQRTCYFLIAGFYLAAAILCLVMLWVEPPRPRQWVVALFALTVATLSATLFAWPLWLSLHRYRVDEQGITRLRPWSGSVMLPWDRMTRIVHRRLLWDLDLHGEGPRGPVVFPLGFVLRDSDRLWMAVMQRVGWLAHSPEWPGTIELPAVVRRSRFGLRVAVLIVFLSGFTAFCMVHGYRLWWLPLLLLPIKGVRILRHRWYALEIDRGSLVILTPLRRHAYTADDIEAIGFGPMSGCWMVLVRLRSGQTWYLEDHLIRLMRVCLLIGEAFPEKVGIDGLDLEATGTGPDVEGPAPE